MLSHLIQVSVLPETIAQLNCFTSHNEDKGFGFIIYELCKVFIMITISSVSSRIL